LLTYKILKPKARPNRRQRQSATSVGREIARAFTLKSDDELRTILDNNLKKNYFNIGERVKFKKPRRNPVYGTIVDIQSDIKQVTWTQGGTVPMNIVVEIEKVDPDLNMVYGTERVKTNVKKLLFVGPAK
jgi:hypothetical protein